MTSRFAGIAMTLVVLGAWVPVRSDDPATPKVVSNPIRMKFAVIPSGDFVMGSPAEELETDAEKKKWVELTERPQKKVRISSFRLGVTEVTVGQFRTFVELSGDKIKPGAGAGVPGWNGPGFDQTDEHPVTEVSWDHAVAFCNWLSRFEGLEEFYKIKRGRVTVADWKANGYRLPTNAEWEYACRAGTKTRFSCPEAELKRYAWYDVNSGQGTHPVGEKLPNKFGLFDMLGNVDEWCWNSRGPAPEGQPDILIDPRGPDLPDARSRVARGGCWAYSAWSARTAHNSGGPHQSRSNWGGFRVARNQPKDPSK